MNPDSRTNDVLNDGLDGSQWHVTTGYFRLGSSSPLIWWYALEEGFKGGKHLHRIERPLLKISRNAPGEFPKTFEDEFSQPRLLRVWSGGMSRKWFCDLRKQAEQGTGFKRVKDRRSYAFMVSILTGTR
jgi:hypothetical protein